MFRIASSITTRSKVWVSDDNIALPAYQHAGDNSEYKGYIPWRVLDDKNYRMQSSDNKYQSLNTAKTMKFDIAWLKLKTSGRKPTPCFTLSCCYFVSDSSSSCNARSQLTPKIRSSLHLLRRKSLRNWMSIAAQMVRFHWKKWHESSTWEREIVPDIIMEPIIFLADMSMVVVTHKCGRVHVLIFEKKKCKEYVPIVFLAHNITKQD